MMLLTQLRCDFVWCRLRSELLPSAIELLSFDQNTLSDKNTERFAHTIQKHRTQVLNQNHQVGLKILTNSY